MKKTLLSLILLLSACAQSTGNIASPHLDLKPSTPPPQNKYICIMSTLPVDWPLVEAQYFWNINGKNLFTQNQDNCDGQIEFWMTDSDKFWGETRFLYRNYALIYFNVHTPKEMKSHVLCHELGHVLGLPHSAKSDTCMNIDLLVSQPSWEDLQYVGKDLWNWEYASRQATGH